jgi:NADPH-dependent 2,4-dienoyl-CoA reductase/sulfur reductase-like enzyme/nitrite reductase/ring-hydroxylating ferredoxin subunit
MENKPQLDLKKGVALGELADGAMVAGVVDGEEALLVRRGDDLYAIGAHCTHYHGPLADGLIAGDTVRCPWHHACFSLATGEALYAPALDPISCWRVERVGDMAFVREKLPESTSRASVAIASAPASIVIVGGGAAGLAAADMLRREGYDGPVTMLSADDSPPVDRPNLSKDYLAGTAPDEWLPLRTPEFYAERKIELVRNARVASIEAKAKRVHLADGGEYEYGALLIATGADPVVLDIPGAQPSQIHYLRTLADSQAIVAKAKTAKEVVVVGASFIGLEVAASLRARGIAVHVVGPERVPLERVLGTEVGGFIRELHESRGVVFHLGTTVAHIEGERVTLADGSALTAEFVVVGVGVRPALALAETAGLALDRGIAVDQYLETSVHGIYAAGDVARWPDPHSGERLRIEHWVVAERQGQVAAKNILGHRKRFDAVPFFWSQHYDVTINYVGHAQNWDSIVIDGSLAAHDCTVTYKRADRALAVATISRDLESLKAERALETRGR